MSLEQLHDLFEKLSAGLADLVSLQWLAHGVQLAMQILLALLAIWVVERCARSLLQFRMEKEIWGTVTDPNGTAYPLLHWENTLGRSRRCDVVLPLATISRNHAVLQRSNDRIWYLIPLQAKNGVTINGRALQSGQRSQLKDGDVLEIGGLPLTFRSATQEEERAQAKQRTRPGRMIRPFPTLLLLTLFQLTLFAQLAYNLWDTDLSKVALVVTFFGLCILMWLMYLIYRSFRRTGFELETLAFFLTTLCLGVTASSAPSTLYTQFISIILGLILFFVLSLILRNLRLSLRLRWVAAILACGLLCFNLLFAERIFGAKNWISIGPVSFQPSELVKLAFILVGATTLERMFARRNLIFTLLFSAFCVGCLALMSDFGTAVIFFMTFLAIAFLRSGDLPSIAFFSCGAVLAGFLVLHFKPYIANRFAVYRHVWEDTSNYGYQQSRTMSAIASGGLFGNGVGNGWLKNLGAANTDLVFGMVAEELGLILAITAVAVIVIFVVTAVKYATASRSTFYAICACSCAMLLAVQTMLNVFGSVDLLPLTGVTFPFVSCGGSSMLSCWGLLAYLKAADTRQNAGLSIALPKRRAKPSAESEKGGNAF